MAVTVEQQARVLNTFALTLQNNLLSREIVQWGTFDNEMDDRDALQVFQQVKPRYVTYRTEGGVRDLTAGLDTPAFGSEVFEVTGSFGVNMGLSDWNRIRDVGNPRHTVALEQMAINMAEQIDAYIFAGATLASADWTGAGSTASPVAAWRDVAAARARLEENGVVQRNLSAVLLPSDRMELGDQLVKLPAPTNESERTYRRGFDGEVDQVRTLFTNQLPTMTTGTRSATAMTVSGAAQNVNYSAVARGHLSGNGQRLTQTIVVAGLAAGATIVPGEVFTIAGVNAFDNRKQAPVSPARLQQFTVVAAATGVGGGTTTLQIFPAIVVPGTGSGTDLAINTAHATVTAAPADGAAITFIGQPSTVLAPRLMVDKEAFVVNSVPLIMPAVGQAMRRTLKDIPVSIRQWIASNPLTGDHMVRYDAAMNFNIVDRYRATRLNGGA